MLQVQEQHKADTTLTFRQGNGGKMTFLKLPRKSKEAETKLGLCLTPFISQTFPEFEEVRLLPALKMNPATVLLLATN